MIDIVYFSEDDEDNENKIKDKATNLFKEVPINIDLVNQGNVHLWYRDDLGMILNLINH
jgi:hypothetical protein